MSDEEAKLELERRRWTNRRRIAWTSLFTAVLQTLAILYLLFYGSIERLQAVSQYGAIIMAMYGLFAGNIMAYIASAGYSDVRLWKP